MQLAKDEVQSISAIARDSIKGQAFAANAGALLAKLNVLWIATPTAGGIPLVMATALMADIIPKVATPIPRAVLAASWDKVTGALVVRALTPTSETR